MPEISIGISWHIHNIWSQLLAGTRFLLDQLHSCKPKKTDKIILIRASLVLSFQMVEIIFFEELKNRINRQGINELNRALECDLEENISFSKALRKWPEIIDGQGFDWGSEPFQSLEKLRCWRNKTIHFEAKHPSIPDSDLHLLGESAYYTAIEASKAIFDFFNKDTSTTWNSSKNKEFVKDYPPQAKILFQSLLAQYGIK